MTSRKTVTKLFAMALLSTTVIPAFAIEANEVTGTPGTGNSNIILEVKDDGSGGGDTPDPSPDPGEVVIATVPIELPIVMNLKGDITVPTEAKIINHSDKDIKVSKVEVAMESGWSISDNINNTAKDTKEVALSFRNDKLNTDGLLAITNNNWNVAAKDELDLNMKAQIPVQTTESKGKIGTVSFTLAEYKEEVAPPAPEPVMYTITFETEKQGVIEGNTTITAEDGDLVGFPVEKSNSARYEFDGWYYNAYKITDDKVIVNEDRTYRAYYKKREASPESWFVWNDRGALGGFSDEYKNMVNAPTDIVIPESINGSKVDTIGERAFENNTKLTSVVIPESIQIIENDAFKGCTSIKELNIDFTTPNWVGGTSPFGLDSEDKVKWASN